MSFSENKNTKKVLNGQIGTEIHQGKLLDLQPIDNKRVEVSFTTHAISSDGGLLLIRGIEERKGIVKPFRPAWSTRSTRGMCSKLLTSRYL